jgi:hypothetical protein
MLSIPAFNWLVRGFEHTFINIAGTGDERTLILQVFVYIILFSYSSPFRLLNSCGVSLSNER